MSRVAKKNVIIPSDIQVILTDSMISVHKDNLKLENFIHCAVKIQLINNELLFSLKDARYKNWAIVGTTRAIVQNMIIGIKDTFTKNLKLIGVGYRAIIKDDMINLFLGFSHSINYKIPKDITVICQSPTEIRISGCNKEIVGQVAANLRSYRKPEPYKGKGIRYEYEIIRTKEAKKK